MYLRLALARNTDNSRPCDYAMSLPRSFRCDPFAVLQRFRLHCEALDTCLVPLLTDLVTAASYQLKLAGLDWISCLRAPQIAALAADQGPLQMSLFDERDLAEITSPDFPGERLIACRNPALAAERARKREALLRSTERPIRASRSSSERFGR